MLVKPAPAVEKVLDALDSNVVIGMILAPAFGVPGIVPAFITLKGNKTFETAIEEDDFLKKCLGAITKVERRA